MTPVNLILNYVSRVFPEILVNMSKKVLYFTEWPIILLYHGTTIWYYNGIDINVVDGTVKAKTFIRFNILDINLSIFSYYTLCNTPVLGFLIGPNLNTMALNLPSENYLFCNL